MVKCSAENIPLISFLKKLIPKHYHYFYLPCVAWAVMHVKHVSVAQLAGEVVNKRGIDWMTGDDLK